MTCEASGDGRVVICVKDEGSGIEDIEKARELPGTTTIVPFFLFTF